MKNKSPAFQFYPKDYLSDINVQIMSLSERGAYMNLLCHEWLEGGLPNDDEILSILSGLNDKWLDKSGDKIRRCFVAKNGKLFHPRLKKERDKQKKWKEKSSLGGQGKWGDSSNPEKRSVRLSEARKKGRHTKNEWDEMRDFFNNTCVRCGDAEPKITIVKDHIMPIYQGGSDGIENLQPLCKRCNSSKGKENTDHRASFNKHKRTPAKMPAKWQASVCSSTTSSTTSTPLKNKDIYIIFDFWNSQGITKHKTIDKSKPTINASLKEYSEDEIKGAILNYKKILGDSTYYWTHKWTLKEFLQRGMDKFRDENKPFDNYRADKKGGSSSGKYTGLDEKDYSEGIGEDGSF